MKLLIFDSNSILNRAFYGIRLLTAKDGSFTNAIYGFFNIVLRLIDDIKPDETIFAFDLPGGTFRNTLYEGYKANRKGMPPELAQQLPVVKELIGSLGYAIAEQQGYEADDILGTVSAWQEREGGESLLCTGDRDSLQLVSEKTVVILAATKAGGAQYIQMTPQAVREKYGVEPRQLIDVKALMGDSSDNIPGVAGVGEKTAFALIQRYGTLETIYADVEALEATQSVKTKLAAGRESAQLSRQLGEICRSVPMECSQAAFARREPDNAALYRTLSRLELFKLIERLGLTPDSAAAPLPTLERAPALPACAASKLPPAEQLYVVYHPDDSAEICARGAIYCIASGAAESIAQADAQVFITESKPYYKALIARGRQPEPVALDISLAAYLLNPNSSGYSPERLVAEYAVPLPEAAWQGEGEAPQSARFAAALPELCRTLEGRIDQSAQRRLLEDIEQPLALVLADMELAGFEIDLEGLADFGRELTGLTAQLEREIYSLAGHEFNINSPKQLGDILFGELGLPNRKKTKTGWSTDAEVLESLAPYHEIVSKILDYRKYAKLSSTYVDGLAKAADADGRIRTSFLQTETRTGRLSSAEPNMQNIPVRTEPGSRMRAFFSAAQGKLLVDADYSQIELRVLAAIADDKNMIEAFRDGEDIHTQTASQVFDLPPLFVTPLMRSRAKAVNFGIVYGIGAFSLSKDIGVTVAEADKYIKNYMSTYAGVARYMLDTVETAKKRGYAETIFGRRRYLPELTSTNHNMRAFGERVARNMPIQGAAADIIKIAMVRVYNRLKTEGMAARLILQVHDELIVEAPEAEAERARLIVREEMEHAASLSVPLEVDAKVGKTWAQAH